MAQLQDCNQFFSVSTLDFRSNELRRVGCISPILICSGASVFKYPLQPITNTKGILYNCTKDVIVEIEFANPAFCIKTNEGLEQSDIPL